jgi:hypothetical protein
MMKVFTPNVGYFLINLLNFRSYLKAKHLTENGWFFCTHEHQQLYVNLSEKQIRAAKSTLKECNIIKTKMKGMPIKEWYFIDVHVLYHYLDFNVSNPTYQGRDEPTFLDRDDPSLIGRVYLDNKYLTKKKEEEIITLKGNNSSPQKGEVFSNKSTKKQTKTPDELLLARVEKEGNVINPILKEPFMMWLKYKRNRGESYKDSDSTFLAYKKLLKFSNENNKQAIEVIEQSMSNNWSGLFEIKEVQNNNNYKAPSKITTGYRSSNVVYREAEEIM